MLDIPKSYVGLAKSMLAFVKLFHTSNLFTILKKWEEFGFYDYGVNQELGWFYPENFPDRYKEIIEGVEDFKECKTGCVF